MYNLRLARRPRQRPRAHWSFMVPKGRPSASSSPALMVAALLSIAIDTLERASMIRLGFLKLSPRPPFCEHKCKLPNFGSHAACRRRYNSPFARESSAPERSEGLCCMLHIESAKSTIFPVLVACFRVATAADPKDRGSCGSTLEEKPQPLQVKKNSGRTWIMARFHMSASFMEAHLS